MSPTLGEELANLCDSINALRNELPRPLRWLIRPVNADHLRADLNTHGLDHLPADQDPRQWNEEDQ